MTVSQTIDIAGVTVSRIGFAGLHLAGAGGWGRPADPDAAAALLRTAVELGVGLIDTADTIGPGVSEEVIRDTLHPYASGLLIATKAGMTRSAPHAWGVLGRPDYLKQQAYASLHRLRIDRIPLFTLHRVDPLYPLADQVGALAELRRDGVIGEIGLSAVTAAQVEEARRIVPIASVQSHYNLVSRAHDEVVTRTGELGIPFVAFWGLGHGRDLIDATAVQAVASRLEATVAQVLLAWLLQRAPHIVTLPGTGDPRRLRSNYAALDLVLDQKALDDLETYATTAGPIPDIPRSPVTP
jgi:aryl-alcohol dehydrogenase-like predicted oxidoreductase